MTLNKVICGVLPNEPIPIRIDVTEEMKKEATDLLNSVYYQLECAQEYIRRRFSDFFFAAQRENCLEWTEDGNYKWKRKPFDMLLEQLPWDINMTTLPWNDHLIFTEWHMS